MYHDAKEVDRMPVFPSDLVDINPLTFSKLSEADKLMHIAFTEVRREISIVRQENRWLAERLVVAYNRSLRHDALIEATKRTIFGIPVRIVIWVSTAAGGAFIGIVINNWMEIVKK